jgi:hypothetical protein
VTLHRKTGPQVAAVIGDEIGGFQKSSCSKHVDQRMQVSKYFTLPPPTPPWCPKGDRYLLFASFSIHFEQSLTLKIPQICRFFSEAFCSNTIYIVKLCIQNVIMESSSSSQWSMDCLKSLGISPEENVQMTLQQDDIPQASQDDAVVARNAPKLPRTDGGWDAWLFLVGCFVFEALVWGNSSL